MPSDLNKASQFTPRVSSSPSRTVRQDARRPQFGLGVRMRTFIKLAELDRALSDGADPRESRELALRGQQLAKPRKRIRFARAIERVVADVGSPGPQILLGVYRRGPVLKNRTLLRALADRLRAEAPVSLRGLAMVDLLLYCGHGPLYGAQSAAQLEGELAAVLTALEPEGADPALGPVSSPRNERRLMGAFIASPETQPARASVASDAGERAAHLVSHLPLADGLRVCLSLADTNSPSFELAALRWHSCFCSRAFGVSLAEAQALLSALACLPGVGRRAAAEEVLGLSLQYQQDETVAVLYRWLRHSATGADHRFAGPGESDGA